MKRNLLGLALLMVTTCVYAGGDREEHGNPTQQAGGSSSVATAGSNSSATALGGSASASIGGTNVNFQGDNYDSHRNPVASAIAPDVYTGVICPIITQGSHAVQLLVFGGSTTGVASVNAICVAYHLGQTAVVERMTCKSSKEYREANPNCEVQ